MLLTRHLEVHEDDVVARPICQQKLDCLETVVGDCESEHMSKMNPAITRHTLTRPARLV